MSKCPICNSEADSRSSGGLDGEEVSCSRCGNFRISRSAAVNWRSGQSSDARQLVNASGWIRQHQNVLITSDIVETLTGLALPRVPERALNLLAYVENKTRFLGDRLSIPNTGCEDYLGVAYANNVQELNYLFEYLMGEGRIGIFSRTSSGISVYITPLGFSYLEQARYSNTESQIGFCAMWFDDSVKPIWTQAIFPALSDAGYEPKRIDEHHHNNRIDDEIIALIRRSKFVVADFTGQRGGVYFEAGFALGMNLPVIWTVKKSELASVHFDNRQYNFVTWEEDNLPEFKLDLQYRIEATLGRGTWTPDA
jgi:hypothetical protein